MTPNHSNYYEEEKQPQFENFTASRLYCPTCRTPVEVREKLLLILPDGELYDYTCPNCGSSLGDRKTGLAR